MEIIGFFVLIIVFLWMIAVGTLGTYAVVAFSGWNAESFLTILIGILGGVGMYYTCINGPFAIVVS
jgi:hypothetical protein